MKKIIMLTKTLTFIYVLFANLIRDLIQYQIKDHVNLINRIFIF